jgi:phosphopantetheinyl transferase
VTTPYLRYQYVHPAGISLGAVRVTEKTEYLQEIAKEIFDPEDWAVFNTYKFPKKQLSHILGRLSSKIAAQEFLKNFSLRDVKIANALQGNPILLNGNYDLTIAHAGNFGVSICHSKNFILGIDLELVDNFLDRLLLELDFFISNGAFFEDNKKGKCTLWTAMEAASKHMKIGITTDFSVFEVRSSEKISDGCLLTEFVHIPSLLVLSFDFKNIIMSICVHRNFDLGYLLALSKDENLKEMWN